MRSPGMRKLGPEALTEAITVPSAFRTGAAMAVRPASNSSTAAAKPRRRPFRLGGYDMDAARVRFLWSEHQAARAWLAW